MLTHDIINDSFEGTLLSNELSQFGFNSILFPISSFFMFHHQNGGGYIGFGVDPIGMTLMCKISHELVG